MSDMYTRQESLNLNTEQKFIIVGCGGIGWHVVKGLVMAGVSDMIVFDHDLIEVHNLPRLDIPSEYIGKNKAYMVKKLCDMLRPDNNVEWYPYKFHPNDEFSDFDWLIDCSDVHSSQIEHQEFAKNNDIRYVKAGYNGSHITVANTVAEWDTDPNGTQDGYTITPSFISPAIIVAGLVINKVLTESDQTVSADINNIF